MAWVELTEGCERPNPWWLLSRNQLEKVPGFTLEPVVDWLTGPNNLQNHHFCWWYNKKVKKKVFGHVWAISNSYPHALLVLPHPYFLTKKMILTSCTTGSIGSVANRQPAVLGWRQRASAARETRPVQRSPPVVHWSRTVLQPGKVCLKKRRFPSIAVFEQTSKGFNMLKKKLNLHTGTARGDPSGSVNKRWCHPWKSPPLDSHLWCHGLESVGATLW